MYNGGKIILGLIVFLFIMTFPIWYNLASEKDLSRLDPIAATKDVPGKDRCVLPKEEMRASHMDLLNEWREIVVRRGERIHTTPDGRNFNRSLSYIYQEPEPTAKMVALTETLAESDSNVVEEAEVAVNRNPMKMMPLESEITGYSCMDCHSNRDQFCDRCHFYVSVDPYCWDCHIEPRLVEVEK